MVDNFPPQILAQFVMEHAQNPAALLIGVAVKNRPRVFESVADDGTAIAPRFLVEINLGVMIKLVIRLIAALVMLLEQYLEISGEALVKPGMGPVAAGDQIAEPLMRQFV